ncbi:MAG: DUF952 domain-containing protein [Chloroflexi bacterium]|nr:DUF952 domain-containing protein [Chloroflexota bacterium]MCY3583568.1 DUF952 domain-containing protein [Chloroflexota bacterium]MCY3715788.1 DUF952 domain-containing protein [Chloroflexota bacterium]MDE2651019.1 DUF952 domain-containing protein [Chloroflexota bacterium]MXV92464.1 DUF952 domain-containing protein [Chloroflexota bacterium]
MIYHIATRDDWAAAQATGSYRAASLDSEGFIHCSSKRQTLPVAQQFYRGQGDLLLLCIDESQLTAPLAWEAPAHPNPEISEFTGSDSEFPHIYGALNLDAVLAVKCLREGRDGFVLA